MGHLRQERRPFFAAGRARRLRALTHEPEPAKNLVRNLLLAWRLLGVVRPRVLLTTGAGVAVPFAWLGRLRGVRIVYVESFTRIEGPSLTGRLVGPIAHRAYVQWPEMESLVPKARYAGNVFARP